MSDGTCQAGERCSCGLSAEARAKCALWTPGEQKPIKVFGIAFMAPKQKAAVLAHCYGDCGKISMAGVIDAGSLGGLAVCCESTCPHVALETDEPFGQTMSFGQPHDVYIRALKPEGGDA